MTTPQIKLTAARNSGAVVTVHTDDGKALTGVVMDTMAGGPYPMCVKAEGVDHNMLFHPEDVVAVEPAS